MMRSCKAPRFDAEEKCQLANMPSARVRSSRRRSDLRRPTHTGSRCATWRSRQPNHRRGHRSCRQCRHRRCSTRRRCLTRHRSSCRRNRYCDSRPLPLRPPPQPPPQRRQGQRASCGASGGKAGGEAAGGQSPPPYPQRQARHQRHQALPPPAGCQARVPSGEPAAHRGRRAEQQAPPAPWRPPQRRPGRRYAQDGGVSRGKVFRRSDRQRL